MYRRGTEMYCVLIHTYTHIHTYIYIRIRHKLYKIRL